MPDTSRKLRDPERLNALHRSHLLSTRVNEVFDTLTRIVTGVLGVPISLLVVMDKEKQYFQGASGIPQAVRLNPPTMLFVSKVIASGQPFILENVRSHPQAKANEAVEALNMGAFLGVPVMTATGQTLGALIAIAPNPRHWDGRDVALIHDLATLASTELERKTAEAQTKNARAELAAERALGLRFQAHILNTVQQAVIATDPEGVIVYWNCYAETLYGWKAEEALGNHISDLVIGDGRDAHWKEVSACLASGKPWTRERMLKRKNGSSFHALITLSPMHDASGDQEGIVGVSIDVTNQKHLEEQIRQSQKMETVGRLTGGIAHDFNNLLTVIRLNADLVLEQMSPSLPPVEDIKQIRDSANRAASLTKQLLAFSRKQILTPRPVDLNAIVSDVQPILARLVGDDIGLSLDLKAKGHIVADSGQIDQILVNLIVNSRDAMVDGGTVVIRTENVHLDARPGRDSNGDAEIAGNYITLSVSDTGMGMSEATRKRALDAFFTTKPPGAGTGLGLSTVSGIVTQSAGHIRISSAPGKGTTVRVYFPKVEDKAVAAIERKREAAPGHRGGETILVVDDESGVRRHAVRILRDRGYNVLEAVSGSDAMRLATESADEIDLVLSDVVMPELPGRDLAEKVAAVRPGTRFVFMSGRPQSDLFARGLLYEGVPFVGKPFTPEELANTIRDALDAVDPPEPESQLASMAGDALL